MTPTVIFYLYTRQIWPKNEIAQSALVCLERVQMRPHIYTAVCMINYFHLITLSYRQYTYFNCMCYDELHFFVPPTLTFTPGTLHTTYRSVTHLNTVCISMPWSIVCLKTAALWNRLLASCCPKHYFLEVFKWMITIIYPAESHKLEIFPFLTLIQQNK